MTTTKITSLMLLSSLLGAPAIFASATDADAASQGRHFRSPMSFSSTAKPEKAAEPAEAAPVKAKAVKAAPAATGYDDSLFPPTAKPGECYTRVLAPATTSETSERMLVKDESFRLIEVPAVIEQVDEKILVTPASQRQEIIPATYKQVEEQILVSPAYKKQIPVPATYETRSERVMVKPERSSWKKGNGPLAKIDGATGEIMCYVTEPAVYENVKRTVLVSPATVREELVPAEYKTIKRTVVDQAATTKTIDIPAEYTTVKVSRVTTAASVKREAIPAEYRTVTKRVSNNDAKMEWRQVVCETNITPVIVSDLQTALNAKGYSAGEVTGSLNGQTLKALDSYQIANNLPQGGVTIESLNSLGVKF